MEANANLSADRVLPLGLASLRLHPAWRRLAEGLLRGDSGDSAKQCVEPYADPTRLELSLRAMTDITQPVADALAERFPWQKFKTFIDIGTGEGALPVALATAHPQLTGGGFDLPQMRPWFERHVAAHGVADRLRFHAGDCLAEPLPQAEVLGFGHIFHGWDLATKRRLLAKAHAALPDDGVVVVYEQMIHDHRRAHAARLPMRPNRPRAAPELAIVSLLLGQSRTARTGTQNDNVRVRSLPILSLLKAWHEQALLRREICRLLETSDHLLDDVGFDADTAARECRRHFWQPVALRQKPAFPGERAALSLCDDGRLTPQGFDYTVADCRGWLRAAGFAETYAAPLTGPYAMVVGLK